MITKPPLGKLICKKTTDPKRMLTHGLLDEAIRRDPLSIESVTPCTTATKIEYEVGATSALVWNEGQSRKTRIYLPLNDGWYVPDENGKQFAIPNGSKSTPENQEARYLFRSHRSKYLGSLARDVIGSRGVGADGGWTDDFGVELIDNYYLQRESSPAHYRSGSKVTQVPQIVILGANFEFRCLLDKIRQKLSYSKAFLESIDRADSIPIPESVILSAKRQFLGLPSELKTKMPYFQNLIDTLSSS